MASNERYVGSQADIKVQRSRFPLRRRTIMSYFHGMFHPVGAPIEVLPGDTMKAVISCFTRMSPPIVPFIDNVRQEVDFWFVPKRILWNKTKQFYGESPSFGIATAVEEPHKPMNIALSDLATNFAKSESIAGSLGLVMDEFISGYTNYPQINVLPIRALLAVWNENYRDENYQDQYSWDKDQTGSITNLAFINGSAIGLSASLPKVNKDRDVFTTILPYQIKGSPVALTIGGKIPVIADSVVHDAGNIYLSHTNGTSVNSPLYTKSGYVHVDPSGTAPSGTQNVKYTNLVADLGAAAQASISDLLYSLAYQDFLARAAHYGTRYREYIYSMFGTQIPDASEDVPEYLGRLKFNINVQQVVQTTGFDPSASSELGQLGAYSNSGKSDAVFTKSFVEPGYIVIVTYTKHQRTYTSGLDRVWLKTELLDYYQPPFANIADIPIGSFDIWTNNKDAETPLGFQEPWYEYRFLHDRAYGLMNAARDTLGQLWTLADVYASKPTIGAQFMEEDRNAIARVLTTGSNGPDYMMDFQLDIDATRVMPLFPRGTLKGF